MKLQEIKGKTRLEYTIVENEEKEHYGCNNCNSELGKKLQIINPDGDPYEGFMLCKDCLGKFIEDLKTIKKTYKL